MQITAYKFDQTSFRALKKIFDLIFIHSYIREYRQSKDWMTKTERQSKNKAENQLGDYE